MDYLKEVVITEESLIEFCKSSTHKVQDVKLRLMYQQFCAALINNTVRINNLK